MKYNFVLTFTFLNSKHKSFTVVHHLGYVCLNVTLNVLKCMLARIYFQVCVLRMSSDDTTLWIIDFATISSI